MGPGTYAKTLYPSCPEKALRLFHALLLVLSAGEKAPNSWTGTGIVDLSGSGVLTGFANLEVVKSSTLPALELLNGLWSDKAVREIVVLICPPRIPIIFTLTQRLGISRLWQGEMWYLERLFIGHFLWGKVPNYNSYLRSIFQPVHQRLISSLLLPFCLLLH